MQIHYKYLILQVFMAGWCSFAYASLIRVGISSAPNNLNPFFSTDYISQNINRLVHLSLTDMGEQMDFRCRACESFEENYVNGKHILKFKLKKNLKFWDGTPVTAKDVENSVKYFSQEHKNLKSIFRFAFQKIKKVEVIDLYQVNFIYDEYSLDTLSNLTLLKILKIPSYEEKKVELNSIIGCGDFHYGEISANSINVLKHGDKGGLIFKVIKDETTLSLKLINKEIDLSVVGISPRKYQWLKGNFYNDLNFYEGESSNYTYIGINHKNRILAKRNVRKALSLLVPREKILKYKLKGTAKLATSMFSESFQEYYLNLKLDQYDPKMAATLLDQENLLPNKDGIRFILNWKVSNNKAAVEMVNVIKENFEKAGIKINLTIQEWGTFMGGIKTGQFDLFISQWVGFTGPDIYKFVFHSESIPPKGANRGFFINHKLDQLIDRSTKYMMKKERIQIVAQIQRLIAQEYPYIGLWHPNIMWIARKCVNDIVIHPNGSFLPFNMIESSCI